MSTKARKGRPEGHTAQQGDDPGERSPPNPSLRDMSSQRSGAIMEAADQRGPDAGEGDPQGAGADLSAQHRG